MIIIYRVSTVCPPGPGVAVHAVYEGESVPGPVHGAGGGEVAGVAPGGHLHNTVATWVWTPDPGLTLKQ